MPRAAVRCWPTTSLRSKWSRARTSLGGGEQCAGHGRLVRGWEGGIEIEIRDLVIHADGDVAFAHSLNRLAGTRLGGGRTDILDALNLGFRRTPEGWRIVHGHHVRYRSIRPMGSKPALA
jgi:ketosteroid isomerase-like protein